MCMDILLFRDRTWNTMEIIKLYMCQAEAACPGVFRSHLPLLQKGESARFPIFTQTHASSTLLPETWDWKSNDVTVGRGNSVRYLQEKYFSLEKLAAADAMGVIKMLLSNMYLYWNFLIQLSVIVSLQLNSTQSILCMIYEENKTFYGPECDLSW